MNRLTSLLSLLTLFLSLSAQTVVTAYRPGTTTEGVTYFLPKTGLHIVVRAHRTSYTPGPYAAYAERFLEATNVAQQPHDTWTITDLTLTPFGVADRTQAYTIRLNAKTSAPLVGLAPDGRLLSINTDAPTLSPLEQPTVRPYEVKVDAAQDFKTQEMLRAGSLGTKAELTAQEIYDIRENRTLLAKGQAEFNPKDGEQLRLMLQKLDEQERAFSQLFLGTTREEDHVFTFDLVPDSTMTHHEVFRFSRHLGMVDADDPVGTPFYLTITDLHTLPEETLDPKAAKKMAEAQDLRYCNPGTARITLTDETRTYLVTELPLAQLGRVEHLGGDLFNKKFSTRVRLSPTTGGIERLDLSQPTE